MSTIQRPAAGQRERLTSVGKHVERSDAEQKIDGSVEYGDDLEFPGVKHIKVCRSTVPHGDLVSIDTSEAEAMPGVHMVVTRDDVRRLQAEENYDPYFGPAIKDQTVLALDKVHFVGEPVAAVIADEPDIAEEAVDRIQVEYDEDDFSTNVDESLAPDAPIIHEEFESSDTFDDLEHVEGGRGTNEAFQFNLRHGDADGALEDADHVFEHTYRTPHVQHMPLEPFVAAARADASGSITVWTPNQSPHFVRNELSKMFDVPESKVTVKVPQVGGSYGAKLYTKIEPLVSLCAYLSGHTVKLHQSIEESFVTNIRHETKITLRTGVTDDGDIVGRKCDVYYDTGAFAEIGPRITKKSGYTASGPYEIPNVSIDSHCVYTNKPPAGAFRGFGVPQLVTAYEAQMGEIARALDVDPVDLRRQNAFREGSIHPTGAPVHAVGLVECVDAIADEMDWGGATEEPDEPHVARGRAIACGYKACITPSASGSIVVMHGDGSVTVHTSSVEIGQGVKITLAQMVAEELDMALDDINVAQPDTDTSPFDTITAGSRSTFHMGNAVLDAVQDVRAQLRGIAAGEWDVAPSDVTVEDGLVTDPASGRTLTYEETLSAKFGKAGGTVVGRGYYVSEGGHHDPETGQSDRPTVFWFWGATGVVIDVDTETGKIDVKEMHNAADVGQIIDPERVKGQIIGGATHALGQTLNEEMVFEFGQQTNQTLLDYKIPSIKDMPDEMTTHIVEVPDDGGPFGAKGVGETGSFAVSPAVMNALADATGASTDRIPLLPERVLDAIDGGDA